MSQDVFDNIDPAMSGTDLAGVLNLFKDALMSGLSGTARPAQLQPGGTWVDTSNDPTTWSFKLWTGSDDVEVFKIDLASGGAAVSLAVDSFTVRKVSPDAVGAVLELVKRRVASGGQVNIGDVVGEIRMVGRDNLGGNPVVAKIMYTAGENQTSTAFGGTLSFHSTPVGTNTLVEHMRFINGIFETLVPHKLNSQQLVAQEIATTATINQLSAEKILVEMIGSTNTSIRGLNSSHASKVVTIHNRSSAIVTIENEHASAAASDRIKLPNGSSYLLTPDSSITLFKSEVEDRWKVKFQSAKFDGFSVAKFFFQGDWVAPAAVSKVRLTAKPKFFWTQRPSSNNTISVIDASRKVWTWGAGVYGEIGNGSPLGRSSPTALLGDIRGFKSFGFGGNSNGVIADNGTIFTWGQGDIVLGTTSVVARSSPVAIAALNAVDIFHLGTDALAAITPDGTAYTWGSNSSGKLGTNSVAGGTSIPTAVTGTHKFSKLAARLDQTNTLVMGLTINGDAYGWGANTAGGIGDGTTVSKSTPTLVLGGHKFKDVLVGNSNGNSAWGVTESGDLYAWGFNTNGNLGLGDNINRSSPVLVMSNINEIFASEFTFFAVAKDGNVYAWGANTGGQLGDNTVVGKSTPTLIMSADDVRKIVCTSTTTFLIKGNGDLYAWGANTNGQLGLNDVVNRSTPTLVVGMPPCVDLTLRIGALGGGGTRATALSASGQVYEWGGANVAYPMGTGSNVATSSPVAVLGGLSMVATDPSTLIMDVPVVGGNSYGIRLKSGRCYFGNYVLPQNTDELEIEYIS